MSDFMMEAVKRRKYAKQYEKDSDGEHSEGQSAKEGDQELAPASGASKKDAILGKSPNKPEASDARPAHMQGETQLGEEQGFDKEMHESAPANSKAQFVDPKKDTHDPVDLNRHRNMAGDGSNSKYDKMGVDEHVDVRKQSSKLAGANARLGEHLKSKELASLKGAVGLHGDKASSGEEAGMDSEDAVRHNSLQAGFGAPKSPANRSGSKEQEWDQDQAGASGKSGLYEANGDADGDGDEEGHSMKPKMGGLKGARAALDGFLSKRKKA